MSFFENLLTQRQEYITHYDFEKIKRILKNPRVEKDFGVTIKRTDKFQYHIKAKLSLEIARTQAGYSQPIQVYMEIIPKVENNTKLKIYTNPRWDLVLLLVLGFIISVLVMIFSKDWKTIVILNASVCGAFFWFRITFRAQEQSLLECLEKVLKLKRPKI